jgi:hypothetical protein
LEGKFRNTAGFAANGEAVAEKQAPFPVNAAPDFAKSGVRFCFASPKAGRARSNGIGAASSASGDDDGSYNANFQLAKAT